MLRPAPAWLVSLRILGAAALLSVRAAVRSRVVAALLLLLAAGVLGIPHLVAGDGTPASEMQVRLQYTLTFAVCVLGLATLWASCAAFGSEIDSRRFELTAVKPAHPLLLWIGRWLGILLLDAVLLLAAVVGARVQLGQSLAAGAAPAAPSGLLVSRTPVAPALPPPEEEAQRIFAELQRAGGIPAGMSAEACLRRLTQECRNRHAVLQPGEQTTWTFRLPQAVPRDGRLWLRMRFDTVAESLADVRGTCRLRRAGTVAWSSEAQVNDLVRNEIELPLSAPALAGARDVELQFVYQVPPETPALLIQPRRHLTLLLPQGTFTGNLVRVALAHFAVLAALAALGLTLGACFSFPVAAFTATAMLLVVLVAADNMRSDALTELALAGPPTLLDRASCAVSQGVDAATRPLLGPEPLARAVAGERVPAPELGSVLLWGAGVYPLLCALVAGRVLRRRELARQGANG
jgi:hypothetical protein